MVRRGILYNNNNNNNNNNNSNNNIKEIAKKMPNMTPQAQQDCPMQITARKTSKSEMVS